MDSNKLRSVDSKKYYCPVLGLKVLVLDSNLRCLTAVSKMLHTLGYEVVTASRASEALSIVEKKKDELNLALVEVYIPDMELNVLTKKIRELSNMPYFLMTANAYTPRDLFGSKLCFKKPLNFTDLSCLWKYVLWRLEDQGMVTEDVKGFWGLQSHEIMVNNRRERQPFINTGGHTLQSARIKEQMYRGGRQSESLVLGRKRLTQTYDSHIKFLGGVEAGTSAAPNQRHQLWNGPGLAMQNVENHLQANPIQQHSNIHSSDLNLGSQPLFETDHEDRKRRQLDHSHIQLCNCMHLHSLKNPLLDALISSNQTSTLGQNQLYLPREPFGVARYTSGSGEFKNNVNGEEWAENTTDGKVFTEDTSVYCGDDLSAQSEMDFSTLSSENMHQQFPPLFPVPLLPSDGKEKGISGAKTDEIFYPPSGTQKFSDEDLKICLSMYKPW